jgi:hypothetical protein
MALLMMRGGVDPGCSCSAPLPRAGIAPGTALESTSGERREREMCRGLKVRLRHQQQCVPRMEQNRNDKREEIGSGWVGWRGIGVAILTL